MICLNTCNTKYTVHDPVSHTHTHTHTIDLVDIAKCVNKFIFDEQFSETAA